MAEDSLGIRDRRVPVQRRDVEVAAERERLVRPGGGIEMLPERSEPAELVFPIGIRDRLPVRGVGGDDPERPHLHVEKTRLLAAPDRKAPGADRDRSPGEHRHSVAGGLRLDRSGVPRRLDFEPRESLGLGAKLLQTDDVRLMSFEQSEQAGAPGPDRVQIPGDETHRPGMLPAKARGKIRTGCQTDPP